MTAVPFDRAANLERLGNEAFDVLVIGGGITGAGTALDAATRGLKVALVDKGDLASGTSSKSSKLIHGGLRYLQQREFRLVYENLYERQRLLKNAPHLVEPLPFMIPILGKDGAGNKALTKIYSGVLRSYDLTGGWRIGHRYKRLTKEEAFAHLPTLKPHRLASAFLYWDARADDARLTLTIARTAAQHGAVIATYAPVASLLKDGTKVVGATLEDGTEVRAKVVINATGVWADHIQRLDGSATPITIRPAKGVHVTVPREKAPADIAVVLNVPGDRRSIFVIPWGDRVYLGTTDTDYQGPIETPTCTSEDIAYILSAMNAATTETLTEADVIGTWAGLRPLVADAKSERTADLSRRHAVSTSPAGVVTVTGGKLTTYRAMASDTVDEAMKQLGKGAKCKTKRLKLLDDHAEIDALVKADPSLGEPLVPGLAYRKADAVYAARHEMVVTLEDVLSRRTRALLLDNAATVHAAAGVAALIGPELGWTKTQQAAQVRAFKEVAKQ